MSQPISWAQAYARQADADFHSWQLLQSDARFPECHKLMLLQMACEKLSKAYRCNEGDDPKKLQSSHAYIKKHLPAIIRHEAIAIQLKGRKWTVQSSKRIAAEIELLAPAVRRGGQRPDNCEYPWEDQQGGIHLPLDWNFPSSELLKTPSGITFVKLVVHAIRRFL